MDWEWRSFYTDSEFVPWSLERDKENLVSKTLSKAKLDERPDYYYNLLDGGCGLKERCEKDGSKFELKVRRESKDGLELWDKCMSIKLKDIDKDTGLGAELMGKYLREQLDETNNAVESNRLLIEKMEKIIGQLKESTPQRVEIAKERRQIRAALVGEDVWEFFHERTDKPNVVVVEETLIDVFSPKEGKTATYKTICVEGDSADRVKAFRDAFMLRKDNAAEGYPQFVIRINS